MEQIIFSGDADVEIQGDKVLSPIQITADHVVYQVIGFNQIPIIINDFRTKVIIAFNNALQSNNFIGFAEIFSSPSKITISESENNIQIDLESTNNINPSQRLWFAIGIGDEIPVFDYYYTYSVPMKDRSFAFIALYVKPGAIVNRNQVSSDCWTTCSYSK